MRVLLISRTLITRVTVKPQSYNYEVVFSRGLVKVSRGKARNGFRSFYIKQVRRSSDPINSHTTARRQPAANLISPRSLACVNLLHIGGALQIVVGDVVSIIRDI